MALFPTRAKRFGLKFEAAGLADTHGLDHLALASNAIPESFLEHEDDIPVINGRRFVFDQQATSSCVMNTFGHAIILLESRVGLEFDEPSRLYGYYNARREHRSHLFDTGTYLRTCAHGLRVHGVCSERFWKWSQFSTKVNRRPNWNAMRHAHPRRGGKYVRIYETGDDRINAVQQAILSGHDVGFGTRVGASFTASSGAIWADVPPATEKIAGNHAMLIIGWKTFDKRLYFRVLNSWGDDWRDGGLIWMSAEYIAWRRTQDLHIIYGWDRLQGAG